MAYSFSQSVSQSHQKSSLFTVPHPHLCRQLLQQVQYAAARIRIGRSGRNAWAHPSQAHLLLPSLLCTAWDLLGAPAPATANPSPHSPAPPLNSTKPSREEPNRAKTKAKQTQGGQRTEPKAKRKPAEAAKSPRHLPIPPKFPCIPFPSSLPTHLLLLLLRVSSPAPTSVPPSLSLRRPPLRSRIAPGPTSPARVRAGGGHDAAARGVGAGARLAGGAAGHALLPRLRRAPGVPAQRVQHVLPRLHGRAAAAAAGLLLLLPRAPTLVAPRHPDKAVLLPRRRPRVGGGGRARHLRRADLRHQQRPGALPQREAPAARRRRGRGQGRRVPLQLRDLRPRAARPLPLLLARMQERNIMPWPWG
uniref:Uncharacterized protein n=1 Tax=Zea mays TaxID=4577 RepID=A0A804LVA8_MAIZE